MPSDEIPTPRPRLRRARPSVLAGLHAVFSRPEAMRYWSRPAHESLAQTRAFLDYLVVSPTGRSDDYVVEREGRVIGKAGAWNLPEIGFIPHPDHWREGLGHEALSALIPVLDARQGLARLTADVDPRNVACLALLARLGFVEIGRAERTVKCGDEWCDSVYLALDRAKGV